MAKTKVITKRPVGWKKKFIIAALAHNLFLPATPHTHWALLLHHYVLLLLLLLPTSTQLLATTAPQDYYTTRLHCTSKHILTHIHTQQEASPKPTDHAHC